MKLSSRPLRAIAGAALSVLLLGTLGSVQAQEAPPLSPAATEVLKLVQSGVGPEVIKNYISTSSGQFSLNAQAILYLNDAGVSTDLVDSMMAHDQALATPPPAPASPPPPTTVTDVSAAPPVETVTVEDFTTTLAPYGTWIDVEGYGRCWRPTVVVYDANWQPYCDRGHWVNTDSGWYWSSDYAWGVAFHYGRWFRHPGYGWCWWPDTVWAPSWVTWRSADDYCGWAPLPPFSVYRPGVGFFYRGVSVGVGFDFGLEAGLFTFVPAGHFCEPHPRYFRVDRDRGAEIFHRTAIINNFEVDRHANVVVNRGIPVERISAASHRSLVPVSVDRVPTAGREGWHGGGRSEAVHPETHFNNNLGGGHYPAPNQPQVVPPANNNRNLYNNDGNPGNLQRHTASVPSQNNGRNLTVPAVRPNANPPTSSGGHIPNGISPNINRQPDYNQNNRGINPGRPADVNLRVPVPTAPAKPAAPAIPAAPPVENYPMPRTPHYNLVQPPKTATPPAGVPANPSHAHDKYNNGQGQGQGH